MMRRLNTWRCHLLSLPRGEAGHRESNGEKEGEKAQLQDRQAAEVLRKLPAKRNPDNEFPTHSMCRPLHHWITLYPSLPLQEASREEKKGYIFIPFRIELIE